MRSVCLIHYTAAQLGEPAFHSFIQQTLDVDLLPNRALQGPAWTKDPEANAASGPQQI